MRWFLEEHRDVPALERSARPAARLDRVREVEHVTQLKRIEVCDVEEVAALEGPLLIHGSDHDR
jgi:hypothetical protein